MDREIINKAKEFGASLAGIVNIEELKRSPSHVISGRVPKFGGVGTKKVEGRKPGEVEWRDGVRSAVVIALAHSQKMPDLDWWVKGFKGGTKGNVQLISVFLKLAEWLEKDKQIKSTKIAYHIEHGAVFMKDAAVLAGLGCIGKNNMLLTPDFGPRVRLRVMLLDVDLPSTGILSFDPCFDCKEYCKRACPQKAFDKQVYSSKEYGQNELPGRTGVYSRTECNVQMEINISKGKVVDIEGSDEKGHEVRYCRRCEFACPVGKSENILT
ncbi:MAG: epoxyqueuosine reductase [Desulfamplus sp.]|nr:epoxyqueuosine reductase [Desulfamplus sp.]